MRKQPKARLRIEREVLRTLEARELRQANGGGALPVSVIDICPPPPITGDSVKVCCA